MAPDPNSCPQCGFSPIPSGARFCPNCGERAPQAELAARAQIQVSQKVENMQGGEVTGVKIGQLVGNLIVQADEEAQARRRRELRLLLDKVRRFWLEGVLAQALQGAALVNIGKQPAPDAVQGAWEDLMQVPAADRPPLAEDVHIDQAFEKLDQAVLILDGAGSGKTTTLLALTDELSRQAQSDPQSPVPVVLHLASWAQHPRPLAEWILEEISLRYQIPRLTSQEWLQANHLALLLDGLDEVEAARRSECIEAINAFRKDHGLVPLVICSRMDEYEASGHKLRLAGALVLQPMTDAQVQAYLESCGEPAAALRQAIQEDEDLRSEARNPAMLSIMRLAYQGVPPEALESEALDTLEERRQHAVQAYIQAQFDQPDRPARFSRSQIEVWLGWLARNMRQNRQAGFLLEQLQPAWLTAAWRRALYWLVSRAAAGIWLGLALGGTAEVAGTPAGRAGYVLAGFLSGGMLGAIDAARGFRRKSAVQKLSPGLRLLYALMVGALSGLAFWLVFDRLLDIGMEAVRLSGGAILAYGFTAWVSYRQDAAEDIRPAESLTWSWLQAAGGLPAGLLLGIIVAAAMGWFFSRGNLLRVWLPFSIVYGSLIVLLFTAVAGLRGRAVEKNSYPNQGTHLSARNALRAGLLLGVMCAVLYGLVYGVLEGALLGLRVFSFAILWYGGFDVIKHYWLRLLLASQPVSGGVSVPLNLTAFLDEAAALGLLQRVGGGYQFFNRLIREKYETA